MRRMRGRGIPSWRPQPGRTPAQTPALQAPRPSPGKPPPGALLQHPLSLTLSAGELPRWCHCAHARTWAACCCARSLNRKRRRHRCHAGWARGHLLCLVGPATPWPCGVYFDSAHQQRRRFRSSGIPVCLQWWKPSRELQAAMCSACFFDPGTGCAACAGLLLGLHWILSPASALVISQLVFHRLCRACLARRW